MLLETYAGAGSSAGLLDPVESQPSVGVPSGLVVRPARVADMLQVEPLINGFAKK